MLITKQRLSNLIYLSLLVFILAAGFSTAFAQTASLEGTLRDSLGKPVSNTNVIATPGQKGLETTFSISNAEGYYKLALKKDVSYKIEITALGFAPVVDSLSLREDKTKDYRLTASKTALEEVVVEAKMAMVVKEDTVIYRTDQFKDGTERKLREVLKNLPGVQVDREGNVTVNGKTVNKLMIDGEPFFGGDVKLGTNNIPSDVVDEVVVLDNYNEVGFMKGLSNSDKMAMNIKLKKGKKDFLFGESEGGGGVEDRYYIHPSIFYYSPKTTLNFIGSLNNINDSPLDFDDVRRFKGTYADFSDNAVKSGDEGLDKFSSSGDIRRKKTIFGALNLSQQINKDLRLTAYSIASKQRSNEAQKTRVDYLTQDNSVEKRNTTTRKNGFSNFNKIRLRYKPQEKKDLAYDLVANVTNNNFNEQIDSRFADSTNFTNTARDPSNVEISQYFRYNTRPTFEHTSEIKANYTYEEKNTLTNWNFDRPVFPDIIPVESDGGDFDLFHDYSSVTHKGSFNFQHFWVLNATNHIYPKTGLSFFNQSYNSTDYQKLKNGERNSFQSAGFNNALKFNVIDPYVGFTYKMKSGDFIFRPGLVYHHYFWRVNQFEENIKDEQKGVFLPEFNIEFTPTVTAKLEFDYKLKSSFENASSYANRLRLVGFNQLHRGNENLDNSLYHDFSLNYRDLDRPRGMNYSLNFGYKRRERSIRQATVLEGINQVSKMIYSDIPENSYNISGRLQKRWSDYTVGVFPKLIFSDYSRLINNEKRNYNSKVYAYTLSLRTDYEGFPNFTLRFNHILRNFNSDQTENKFYTMRPRLSVDYAFLKGFKLKANYRYSFVKNTTNGNDQQFQMGDASLYYSGEESPWGFEIRVDNIFDIEEKRVNRFSEFRTYERRIFLQPRTALLILSYQI